MEIGLSPRQLSCFACVRSLLRLDIFRAICRTFLGGRRADVTRRHPADGLEQLGRLRRDDQ